MSTAKVVLLVVIQLFFIHKVFYIFYFVFLVKFDNVGCQGDQTIAPGQGAIFIFVFRRNSAFFVWSGYFSYFQDVAFLCFLPVHGEFAVRVTLGTWYNSECSRLKVRVWLLLLLRKSY